MKAFHNPQRVPLDKVPDGWRMLYKNEAGAHQGKPCRCWLESGQIFHSDSYWSGNDIRATYIVPLEFRKTLKQRQPITRRRFKLSTRRSIINHHP